MSLRSKTILSVFLLASFFAPFVCAQPADVQLERYLTDRGLDDLLAEHLVDKLGHVQGDERIAVAQQLGNLYIRLLDEASTDEDRTRWAGLATTLLRLVPEADSPDLRINLAKAAYMRAESVAERSRLHMVTPAELAQAERVLRNVSSTFLELAQDAHQRARVLENRLTAQLDESEEDRITAELGHARQQRSLGFYYAGWSEYYLAFLTNDKGRAGKALRNFGWLLNAREGDEASFDRLQPDLLRYEHVARAAIGASLACVIQGRFTEAIAWLDSVDRSTDTSEGVRKQVFDRRITVLSAAHLWPDLELHIRRSRATSGPLPPLTARLLVVSCLDALEGPDGRGRSRELIRRLADVGFQDLISEGKVAHVLELVRTYGTEPLGETGFINQYIRGLRAMDRAKEAGEAAGESDTGPVQDRSVAALYREAATMLLESVEQSDARSFPDEQTKALVSAGQALYLAGDASRAADVLERAVSQAATPDQAEGALWLAVVALEGAVEAGDESLTPRRDQMVQLFLASYPGSERAAKLLMRPDTSALVTPEQAVDILLGVPPGSPNYLAARRQASQLLYRLYRKSTSADRTFAGERFLDVASQVLKLEQSDVRSGDVERAAKASKGAILHARQIADAALGLSPPDVERATAALDTLDRIAVYAAVDLDHLKPELAYRRFQIAMAQHDSAAADRWFQEIEAVDGGYLKIAQRLMYRDAVKTWLDRPTDSTAARSVVQFGRSILQTLENDSKMANITNGVRDTVAEAGGTVWAAEHDRTMLDLAIEMDRKLIESGGATGRVLRRHARLLEQAGHKEQALDQWRRLVNGLDSGTDSWYEARYESIRLLRDVDRDRAIAALRQHIALFPELGPTPWAERFRELADSLGVEVPR